MKAIKVRKRPIVVEAVRWDGDNWLDLDMVQFLGEGTVVQYCTYCGETGKGCDKLVIPTLEGPMHISVGDWIIKGVNGEFYPCKPDVFEKSYDRI